MSDEVLCVIDRIRNRCSMTPQVVDTKQVGVSSSVTGVDSFRSFATPNQRLYKWAFVEYFVPTRQTAPLSYLRAEVYSHVMK